MRRLKIRRKGIRNKKMRTEITENQVNEFKAGFCTYGYLDIQAAISLSLAAGKSIDWAVEQVQEFSENCETPFNKIDPVYCVYDAILQEARAEIEQATTPSYNLCNDFSGSGTEIHTAGDFCCTQYDFCDEAKEELKEVLKDIDLNEFSEATQYFLKEIEIM